MMVLAGASVVATAPANAKDNQRFLLIIERGEFIVDQIIYYKPWEFRN